jgi:hypothetical protein
MTILNEADKVYLGEQEVDAVYADDEKIWPKFNPGTLAGLTLWFDASQLGGADGDPISPWPNLADVAKPGIMVGGAPQISVNRLNSQKVVRFFNGQGRMRMTAIGVQWAHTLVYVARMTPGGYSAGRLVTAAYPSANFLTGFWNGFEDVGFSTSGTFFVPDQRKSVTTNWRLYSTDADASPTFGGSGYYPRLFNNGVLLSSGGTDGYCDLNDAWFDTFNISGYSPAGTEESCDCEVAEVVLYNRKLPDADRQMVENYMRDKWLS